MIDDELLAKFDRVQDLPVSEEMLGTYLEGNLHGAEFREVQNYIHDDSSVSSLIDSVEADMNFINDLDFSYHQGHVDAIITEDVFSGISLPETTAFEMDSLIDANSPLTEGIILGDDCDNFIDDDGHSLHSDDQDNNHPHHDPELDFGVTDNIE